MLTPYQSICKRAFDIGFSFGLLGLLWPIILLSFLLASLDTRSFGFFMQRRVGLDGKVFTILKIKTMHSDTNNTTTVTTERDARITNMGHFFRRSKLDELPQLFNILKGDMSFVGPRPDVEGYADALEGEDRIVLSVRPGLTGPASLKYKHEEKLLAEQENPQHYNDKVLWPDKVKINKKYVQEWSFLKDIHYLLETFK